MKIEAMLLWLLFLPRCSASERQFLPGEAVGLSGRASHRLGRSKTRSLQSEQVRGFSLRQKDNKERTPSGKKVINQSANTRRGAHARKLNSKGTSGKREDMHNVFQEKGTTTGKGGRETESEEPAYDNNQPVAQSNSKGIERREKDE